MNKALCFIFGAIAGTALGYYIARQRCEEEIESVKEALRPLQRKLEKLMAM